MGRHLTMAVLCLTASPAYSLNNTKFTVFSLCANNVHAQSEQLNSFHQQFQSLAKAHSFADYSAVAVESSEHACKSASWRSVAASHAVSTYFHGSYRIQNDSVFVNLRKASTLFVDKVTVFPTLSASTEGIPSLIQEMEKLILSEAGIEADSILMSNQQQEVPVFPVLEKTAPVLVDQLLEKALMAYSLEHYTEASEYLLEVDPLSPDFGQAQYLLGKCILIRNDYVKALGYFRNAKSSGYQANDLDEYIYQAMNMNKPAGWYDTEFKRRQWWFSLTKDETLLMLQLMNNLKINGAVFQENYVYRDTDISKLFETTVLPLQHVRCNDLRAFRYFTHADVLLLEDCKLDEGKGIQLFQHLKVFSTDKKEVAALPEIQEYLKKNGVVTVIP